MKSGIGSRAVFVFVAVLAMVAATSPASALESSVSGHVNVLVMWADNGKENDFFIGDNDNSQTRIRWIGEDEQDWGKFGFRIELGLGKNPSAAMELPNQGDGEFEINDRWLEGYFDTQYGKVSLGKGDGAANNTSETDLSGTIVAGYADIRVTAANFAFIDSDTGEAVTKLGETRNDFDGLSRNVRVRYDTPEFAGIKLATSVTNLDAWEVAGFWDAEFGEGHIVAASIGYVDGQDRVDFNQLGMSASYLMPIGLNLTGSYGIRDWDVDGKDDGINYYLKLGWRFAGIHAVAVEWGVTENLDENGDASSSWGAQYVITPWKAVELYLAGRVFSLDRENVNTDDISQVYGGTRIKF
jgi:hypothetical protein